MKSNARLYIHALVILTVVFGILSEHRLLSYQAQGQAQALAGKSLLYHSEGQAQAQNTKHLSQEQAQRQEQSAQKGVGYQSEAQAQKD